MELKLWQPFSNEMVKGELKRLKRPVTYFDAIRHDAPEFRKMKPTYHSQEVKVLDRVKKRGLRFSQVQRLDSPYTRWSSFTDLGRLIELRNLFAQFLRAFVIAHGSQYPQVARTLAILDSEWMRINLRQAEQFSMDREALQNLKNEDILVAEVATELRDRPIHVPISATDRKRGIFTGILAPNNPYKTQNVRNRMKQVNREIEQKAKAAAKQPGTI